MKNRPIRKRLADLRRKEFETYAACVAQSSAAMDVSPAGPPETVALALLAVIHGLGSIAVDTGPEMEHLYDEAAQLVFDRLSGTENSHGGQSNV